MSAAGVRECIAPPQGAGPGSSPRAALHSYGPKEIQVRPLPRRVAKEMCERHHYLGSYPASSLLNFGAFVGSIPMGVAVLSVGPANIHRYFKDAKPEQVACLARFWLSDSLGPNSESRTLGIIIRQLRRHQDVIKAIICYSDPAVGHSGGIYRAGGFAYLGVSSATPKFRLPDGTVYHSRSLSTIYGSHSMRHFQQHATPLELIPQQPKHVYVGLVDPSWLSRLTRPVLPYPQQEASDASN